MADETTAAQQDEQDFAIPGQQDTQPGPGIRGGDVAAQPVQAAPPQQAPAQAAPQAPQQAADQPVRTGKTFFLGNLLKTLLQGAITGAAQGNPNNAFDRGFAATATTPQTQMQEANLSKVKSEADLAKLQTSIAGMKAIQMKYQIARMPQEEQEKYTAALGEFKASLIKSGASVEAKGDDSKALDQQVDLLNRTDPRATSHAGSFWNIPEPTEPGKAAKFDVVFVPGKNRLQESKDFNLPNGETLHLDQGMELDGAIGKVVEKLAGNAKDTSQEFVKSMHATLGNSKMPETQNDADLRMKQLDSFIGLAGKTDPVWSHLAQQEKETIQKAYPNLPKTKAEAKPETGTLQLVEKGKNADGTPHMVAFNTKTGAVKEVEGGPIQKAGFKDANQGAEDALNYATIYEKEIPTGPGDEALMEKFFELAKPSTGFRMSQPQINMLSNARSWFDSAEAKTRHATKGSWFSADQRSQIIHTMKNLAAAKKGTTAPTAKTNGDQSDSFAAFGGKMR